MKMFNDYYKGKRVLVTGHTGFKGSWLSIWLRELGAEVIGYALDPRTKDDNFVRSRLSGRLIDIRGDIRDTGKLQAAFDEHRPQVAFHLAAQPLVRKSYVMPKETYDTNVGGTVNFMECVRNSTVKSAVVITTDKCYENNEWLWGYRENDRLGGHDPYSSSKACAELVCAAYRDSFSVPVSTVRAGNVIGGGDWCEDRLVPDCIRSLNSKKPILVRNPSAVRPWQHVLEPLGGYLLLAERMQSNPELAGAWNFGPRGEMINVKTLVRMVVSAYGSGAIKIAQAKGPHEAGLLALDINKASNLLGWNPVLSVEESVDITVKWYKQSNKDMYPFCVGQLREYCAKAAKQGALWA